MKEEYYDKRRWYDRDPLLSKSMKTLEETDDDTQIKVALNLIKIIIEHNISSHEFTDVSDILDAVEDGKAPKGNARWYDIDNTLRTAINMLENSPDMHILAAKEIAKMVIGKIKEDDAETEEDEDNNGIPIPINNEPEF